MPGNATPQFLATAVLNGVVITAANTKTDGAGTIGTDIFLAFTADATNGSFVEFVRLLPTATTANTTTTATVARVFISSKTSGVTASGDTMLWQEVQLPSVTADSSTNAPNYIDVVINKRLPASYTILVTNHAAPAANSAWRATVLEGNF